MIRSNVIARGINIQISRISFFSRSVIKIVIKKTLIKRRWGSVKHPRSLCQRSIGFPEFPDVINAYPVKIKINIVANSITG
jgi:hypothetical protein